MIYVTVKERVGDASPRHYQLTRSNALLGRWEQSDVVLAKKNVSKKHARLEWKDGRALLTDLQSTNRTYINGHPLPPHKPQPLKPGDVIAIGDYNLTCSWQAPAGFVGRQQGAQGFAPHQRGAAPQPKGPTPAAAMVKEPRQTGPSFQAPKPPAPPKPPPLRRASAQGAGASSGQPDAWLRVAMEQGPGYGYTAIPQGWLLLMPSGDLLFLSDPGHKQPPRPVPAFAGAAG